MGFLSQRSCCFPSLSEQKAMWGKSKNKPIMTDGSCAHARQPISPLCFTPRPNHMRGSVYCLSSVLSPSLHLSPWLSISLSLLTSFLPALTPFPPYIPFIICLPCLTRCSVKTEREITRPMWGWSKSSSKKRSSVPVGWNGSHSDMLKWVVIKRCSFKIQGDISWRVLEGQRGAKMRSLVALMAAPSPREQDHAASAKSHPASFPPINQNITTPRIMQHVSVRRHVRIQRSIKWWSPLLCHINNPVCYSTVACCSCHCPASRLAIITQLENVFLFNFCLLYLRDS